MEYDAYWTAMDHLQMEHRLRQAHNPNALVLVDHIHLTVGAQVVNIPSVSIRLIAETKHIRQSNVCLLFINCK